VHEKDKNFYESALETRMNQIEELEGQLEEAKLKKELQPGEYEPSDVAHLRVENKRLQNLTSDLRRDLQVE